MFVFISRFSGNNTFWSNVLMRKHLRTVQLFTKFFKIYQAFTMSLKHSAVQFYFDYVLHFKIHKFKGGNSYKFLNPVLELTYVFCTFFCVILVTLV